MVEERIEVSVLNGPEANFACAGHTQALADVFTDAVRRHPQDWHVLQPVWPLMADPAALQSGGDQPQ